MITKLHAMAHNLQCSKNIDQLKTASHLRTNLSQREEKVAEKYFFQKLKESRSKIKDEAF